LTPNPDLLATLSRLEAGRPELVVGFAAETEAVLDNARAKRLRKGCDWIVANDVSASSGTFGGDVNTVHLLTGTGEEAWPQMTKQAVADRLAERIADRLEGSK
jgi:phosphopantothenoylcysteine decarboxylase/phosphopantothenate--cysteine ligase